MRKDLEKKLTPLPPHKFRTEPLPVVPEMLELDHSQEYLFTGSKEKISLSEIFDILNAPPAVARVLRYLAAFALTRDRRYLKDIVIIITEFLSTNE